MHDIIFASLEEWYVPWWRRNKFLVAQFASRLSGRRILFVDLPVNVSNLLKRFRFVELFLTLFGRAKVSSPPEFENVFVLTPIKWLPNSLRIGRAFNGWAERREVARACRRIGIQKPVLWINSHYAAHWLGRMNESAVVYDVTDDWTTLTQSSSEKALTVELDESLCRRADAVVVCSERLRQIKLGTAKRVVLIPNGVDAEHYRAVLDGEGPLPGDAGRWRKPVIGYTGTIHADRVDLDLIEHLARMLPDATVALVGPVILSAEHRARLASLTNVVCPGAVPYKDLPQYMRAFDVCMTPHLVTPFTESLNPIKLWEYLAGGKPIVSTNVAGFRDYAGLVYLAGDAAAFVEGVRQALAEDPCKRELRRAEARRHSWASRAAEAESVIRSCTAPHATMSGGTTALSPLPGQ